MKIFKRLSIILPLVLIANFALSANNPCTPQQGCTGVSNTHTLTLGANVSLTGSASSALSVDSTTQGTRVYPRMTTSQRDAIASPELGLTVVNTDTSTIDFFNGVLWVSLQGGEDYEGLQEAYNINPNINLTVGIPLKFSTTGSGETTDFITPYSTSLGNRTSSTVFGIAFTITKNGFINALGYADPLFASGGRDVGLYQYTTNTTGTLLASATVLKSDPLDATTGKWRMHSITPIAVTAGTKYVLVPLVPSSDSFLFYSTSNPYFATGYAFSNGTVSNTLTYPALATQAATNFVAVWGNANFLFSESGPQESAVNFKDSADSSAFMEVTSTKQGTIPEPLMTTADFTAISSKPTGLRAYDTTTGTPAVWNGSAIKHLVYDDGSITGNAATATALQTARTINGTPFDGTVNIGLGTNSVTNTQLRQSGALCVMGNATNATANVSDTCASSDGQVLRRSGTALGFGAIALNSSNAVTGVLPNANTTATSSLTASSIVARDSSGDFTANNININSFNSTGTSFGTTFNLSSLSASSLVGTDVSKNLTSSVSGLSPTFTGLNLSGLNASSLIGTDASKNLSSVNLSGDVTTSGALATTIATNAVSNAKFRQSSGLSVVGNSTNATANVADITASSDNQVLRRSGTAIGFGAVNLASANAVTGTLPNSNTTASSSNGANTIVARDASNATNLASLTLSNGASGLTFSSTVSNVLRINSATGGSNRADIELNRFDSTNGFNRVLFLTGGSNKWGFGPRSGSENFLIWDEVNNLAQLTMTLGSGTTGTSTFAGSVTAGNNITANNGDVIVNTASKTFSVKTGSNACAGTGAVMVGGTVTVNTSCATTGSIISLMKTSSGGTPTTGIPVITISNGISFTITGDASDASGWSWLIHHTT